MIPGIGRAVWIAGSSGENTGRSGSWSTYDSTNDTAWQQWVDDSSTALGTGYEATNTERNTASHSREKAFMAVTDGTQEYLGQIEIDTLDATNAKWTLTGAYDMERAELVKTADKMMMTSLENKGSVVLLAISGTGIVSSGVLTDVLTTGAASSERSFGVLYDAQLPDSVYNDSVNNYQTEAATNTIFLMGGRQTYSQTLSNASVNNAVHIPAFRAYQSNNWTRDIAAPPSDASMDTIRNDMLTRTTSFNSLSHIAELQSGSTNGTWYVVIPNSSQGTTDRHQTAWLPSHVFHNLDGIGTTLGSRDGSNGASSDQTFFNYNGSSYAGPMRQIVRPFYMRQTKDYITAWRAVNSNYNWWKVNSGGNVWHQFIDWRGLRSGSSQDQLTVGWTITTHQAQQQGGVRNESQTFANTTNSTFSPIGSFNDGRSQEGSLDSHTDGIYPYTESQPRTANNDRVTYISDTGRSEAELGEDFIQSIQVGDNTWIGMYPDTTGTKGGNLYLTACGTTGEDIYDIFENYALNMINAEDIASTETHASNSIAVSVTNGADSSSTAFDPDSAVLFKLSGNFFAVLWRKSTTAYISIFSAQTQTSTPVDITRAVDTVNLGTVPAGDLAGTVLGTGVALITCGNYYRFIKVPV
jgi:hypothetical protein